MIPRLRISTVFSQRAGYLRSSRLILALSSVLLIAAVACGTDRSEDGVGAASFQVEGETLTWSPPWEEGDSRVITVTGSAKFNPELQSMFDTAQALGGGVPDFESEQTSSTGTVSILSKNSNGATGELDVSIEEIINQLELQTLEQPGFGEADFGQFTAMLGLVNQLDLGVEFGIDGSGALTGVTNLDELAETVRRLADSMTRLAALAGEEIIDADDIEKLNTALAELPDTEAAQIAADSMLNAATANLFLMRAGEYTVGQPVVVAGKTPTAFGFATDGTFSYELTDISNGTATVQVVVTPGEIDVLALGERLAIEVASALGEDAGKVTDGIAELEPDERSMLALLSSVIFEPYTVMLTLDADTGWVTAADWSIELALPEGFEDLIPEEDRDFDGINPADFAVTLNASATFDEPAAP